MEKIAVKDELSILMELLDEQDEQSLKKISDSIVAYGNTAIPYLEATRDITLDSIVQSRIKKIIYRIIFQNLFCELHTWATLNSKDLLKGYFLISKYFFPDLEEERIMAQVEALKKEVWLELKKGMTPFEETKVISKVFFEVRKYSLNQNPGSMPDCVCLNALLNTGKGYPEAFAMLYAGIAQRLGIPVYGIKMTDSMFVAYVYPDGKKSLDLRNDLRFYINPFAAGVFFQVKQIEAHIVQNYPDDFEKYSGACTNVEFIQKILVIIEEHYIRKNKPDKVEDIKLLIKALNVE